MKIIGHQKIIQFLQRSINNNKLAQAYLFYGPRHIGKTMVAEYFTARLLCFQKRACGKCLSCQQFKKKIHPDVYRVSGSPIGIDSVRRIINALSLKPLFAPYKVVIVEQADNLTIPAVNAFLKLLEEPPAKAVIILIAKNFYKLPATLYSRCQILRFSLPPKKEIIDFLIKEFSLNGEEAINVVDLALNRPGVALDFAKNPEILLEYKKTMTKFAVLMLAKNFEQRINLLNALQDLDSDDLTNLMIIVRDLILINLNCSAGMSFLKNGLNGGLDSAKLEELKNLYSFNNLKHFCYQVLKAQFWFNSSNLNKKLAMENLLVALEN